MFLPWTMTLGQWLFEQQIKLKKKKTGKGRTEERGGVSIKYNDESHFRGLSAVTFILQYQYITLQSP